MPIAPAAALWEATPWSRQSALEKRAHPEHREAMSHIGWRLVQQARGHRPDVGA